MKKKLLSIGKLASLTGVHIQSLRYYEKIGILIPVYIDPETKYRYYSLPQVKIVEAIQYCVELDIPLKEFASMVDPEGEKIDYGALVEMGQRKSEEKIQLLQKKVAHFERVRENYLHGDRFEKEKRFVDWLPARDCLITPFDGTVKDDAFHETIMKLLDEVRRRDLETNYGIGMLAFHSENEVKRYAFLTVLNTSDIREGKEGNLFRIPEGNYLCQIVPESSIHKGTEIFPEEFQQSSCRLLIEIELFAGIFEYRNPRYEIRCLLEAAVVDLIRRRKK